MAWNIRCSAIIPSRSCELHAATTLRIRIEFLEQADAAVTIREHILKGCCLFHFRKVMPVKVKQIEGVEDGIGGGLARAPPRRCPATSGAARSRGILVVDRVRAAAREGKRLRGAYRLTWSSCKIAGRYGSRCRAATRLQRRIMWHFD